MLKWVFGADISPFKRGLEEMRGEVKSFTGSAKGMLASAFGVAGLTAWASKMIGELSRVKDLSERLGIGSESLQKIGYVAKLAGSDLEGAGKAMTVLARSIASAELGNKGLGDSFERLGINIQAFKSLGPEDQLLELSRGFTNASDYGLALDDVMAILGKSGADILPLLKMGPEELAKALRNAKFASQGAVDAVDDLGDKLDALKMESAPVFGFLIQSFQTASAACAAAAYILWNSWAPVLAGVSAGAAKVAEGIKAALTGDFDGAKQAAKEWGDIMAKTASTVGEKAKEGIDAFGSIYDNIWKTPDRPDPKAAEDAAKKKAVADGLTQAAEDRKKLEEEIGKLQEDARKKALDLEKRITDAQERRKKLAEAAQAADDPKLKEAAKGRGEDALKAAQAIEAGLTAKRDMLKVEKEISDLEKDRQDQAGKDAKEKQQQQAQLDAVIEREAEKRREMNLDAMTPAERLKALQADKKASDENAAKLEAKGDKQGAAEERIRGLDIQKAINGEVDKARSELDGLQKINPVIATSSLQSIGAGGSATLFSSESTQRQIVNYLQIIAQNTRTNESGGSSKYIEPV